MSTIHRLRLGVIFAAFMAGGFVLLASNSQIYAERTPINTQPSENFLQTFPNSLDPFLACQQDIVSIIEQINTLCDAMSQNEICYGNRNVEALARSQQIELMFEAPGDHVALHLVRSLRLSTLDVENNLWGVAQLRLLLADFRSVHDVDVLLFGDVYVEDAVVERVSIPVEVRALSRVNMRAAPSLNSLVVTTVEPNQRLLAVGRSAEGAWLQVEDPVTSLAGWIYAELIESANPELNLNDLVLSDAHSPYWRPMQALMFESGQQQMCGDAPTDGMLIQTAEGLTRVTFMINEVVLELLPEWRGERASALVQSNPAQGMTITMLQGEAEVTFGGETYLVLPNEALRILPEQQQQDSPVEALSVSEQNYTWIDEIVDYSEWAVEDFDVGDGITVVSGNTDNPSLNTGQAAPPAPPARVGRGRGRGDAPPPPRAGRGRDSSPPRAGQESPPPPRAGRGRDAPPPRAERESPPPRGGGRGRGR